MPARIVAFAWSVCSVRIRRRASKSPLSNASTILKALQMAVEAGLGGERPADDHTFVVLRRNAKR